MCVQNTRLGFCPNWGHDGWGLGLRGLTLYWVHRGLDMGSGAGCLVSGWRCPAVSHRGHRCRRLFEVSSSGIKSLSQTYWLQKRKEKKHLSGPAAQSSGGKGGDKGAPTRLRLQWDRKWVRLLETSKFKLHSSSDPARSLLVLSHPNACTRAHAG